MAVIEDKLSSYKPDESAIHIGHKLLRQASLEFVGTVVSWLFGVVTNRQLNAVWRGARRRSPWFHQAPGVTVVAVATYGDPQEVKRLRCWGKRVILHHIQGSALLDLPQSCHLEGWDWMLHSKVLQVTNVHYEAVQLMTLPSTDMAKSIASSSGCTRCGVA